MSKQETKDLEKFLKPYPPEVQEMAFWLRDFVWDLFPEANELIYDNYNAVAFGWSTSDKVADIFCSIPVYPSYVHFGFYFGAKLSDPKKMLLGNGVQYRYIPIKNKSDLPVAYVKKLLKEAYANSLAGLKDKSRPLRGATITKSISKVKRRPGVKAAKKKKAAPPKNR